MKVSPVSFQKVIGSRGKTLRIFLILVNGEHRQGRTQHSENLKLTGVRDVTQYIAVAVGQAFNMSEQTPDDEGRRYQRTVLFRLYTFQRSVVSFIQLINKHL